MQATGLARTEVEVLDLSFLFTSGIKGIHGVVGITEWGVPGVPKVVGSWPAYVAEFGGYVTGDTFALFCKTALDRGAKLKISRAAHYATINDASSIAGTTATGIVGTTATAAVGAASTVNDTITINGVDLTTKFGGGVVFTISGSTGNNGSYTVVSSAYTGGNTVVTVAVVPNATADGTVTYVDNGVSVKFFSLGTGGNKCSVKTQAAFNGAANQFDYVVSIAGYPDLGYTVPNVPKSPNSTEIIQFNQKSKYLKIVSVSGTPAPTTVTLSGGAQVIADIVNVDYIGDSVGKNGLNSFDEDIEITSIAVPMKAEPTIDAAISLYAENRKGIKGLVRTPIGLDADGVIDYREGTGAYSHTAITSWRTMMFTGGLEVVDPITGDFVQVPELAGVMACMSRKDNLYNEWFSFSGPKRGVIPGVNGVVVNFGAPAKRLQADRVDARGVNVVIKHPTFGVCSWGNSTLYKTPSLLQKAEVAELVLLMERTLPSFTDVDLFDPNDVETWKSIFRRVSTWMGFLQDNRAVWKWKYEGDQDIDEVSQATVNSSANIDAGQYIFRLFFAPKVGMKYVGVKLVVTNSGVSFELLNETI